MDKPQTPGTFRDQDVAVGKKNHAPGTIQTPRDRHDSNVFCIGDELASLFKELARAAAQNQVERSNSEQGKNESSHRWTHEQQSLQVADGQSIKNTGVDLGLT
jgi:hypothetical protein